MQHFKLPIVHGEFPKDENIIYFSCDEKYYKEFGWPLIKSIIKQVDWVSVHCHLILKDSNFTPRQIERTTYTYEIIDDTFLETIPLTHYLGTGKVKDFNPTAEVVYYSCARFMQLDKIFTPYHRVLQIDCDSLLERTIEKEEFIKEFTRVRAMRKPKTPEKLIASAISFGKGTYAHNFRIKFASKLRERFAENAYWFIDQHVMQEVFADIDFESIPVHWNIWSFKKKFAYFRTAKGSKKTSDIFATSREYWKSMNI